MSAISAYSTSYCYVWFDVPTDTPEARKLARRFIRYVKANYGGWSFMCHGGKGSVLAMRSFDKACDELQAILPPDSQLRITPITDKQIQVGRNFWGPMRTSPAAQ